MLGVKAMGRSKGKKPRRPRSRSQMPLFGGRADSSEEESSDDVFTTVGGRSSGDFLRRTTSAGGAGGDMIELDELVSPSQPALASSGAEDITRQATWQLKNKGKLDRALRRRNLLLCGLGWLGILFMIIELEVAWDNAAGKMVYTYYTEGIKTVNTVLTGLLLGLLYDYYRVMYRQEQKEFNLRKAQCAFLWTRHLGLPFFAEFAICAIHPVPFLDIEYIYFFTDKIGLFMFLRLYLGVRVIRDFSDVYKHRRRILESTYFKHTGGPEFNSYFVIKTLFAQRPWLFTCVVTLVGTIINAFAIYVCEREDQVDFTFWDALYYTCITMATVGYGDLVALSWWGRLFSVLASFFGILIAALFVAVITSQLELTYHQQFAVEWISKNKMTEDERNLAARLLQATWRSYAQKREIWSNYSSPSDGRPRSLGKEDQRRIEYITNRYKEKTVDIIIQIRPYRQKRMLAEKHSENPVLEQLMQLERAQAVSGRSLQRRVRALEVHQKRIERKMEQLILKNDNILLEIRAALKSSSRRPIGQSAPSTSTPSATPGRENTHHRHHSAAAGGQTPSVDLLLDSSTH